MSYVLYILLFSKPYRSIISKQSRGLHQSRLSRVVTSSVLYRGQAPLYTGVGDLEAFPLGITLGVAPGRGNHHCQITAVVEGIPHALLEKRTLQPTTPHLRNCGRTGE